MVSSQQADRSTAPYVFLSYSSTDRGRALAIADALEGAGVRVWLDRRSIPAGATYAVQPGDNLPTVAQRFGVSVTELAAANGISPNAILQIGQQLHVPAAASATPAR